MECKHLKENDPNCDTARQCIHVPYFHGKSCHLAMGVGCTYTFDKVAELERRIKLLEDRSETKRAN